MLRVGSRIVPRIGTFFGHGPPHFHAIYGEREALIAIENLAVIEGRLSRRALNLVLDWAEIHRAELLANWSLAQRREPLRNVAPLE
jgi:hypothetical protein